MFEQRDHLRVNCKEKCIVSLTGLHYPATVKNFSAGGALVQFSHQAPDLAVGDRCRVNMYGEFHGQYYSKVARIEPDKIAFLFLN